MSHRTKKNINLLRSLFRVAPSKIHGRGIFAKVNISKGQYMGEYEGPKATDSQLENSPYTFEVEHRKNKIEIREGKTILRLLNHEGRWPNAQFNSFKLFKLYALKNIKAGDEITFNYGRSLAEIKNDTFWPIKK